MTIDELIALARSLTSETLKLPHDVIYGGNKLARAVLALLTPDALCIASVDDIVSVDSDGYVTVYPMHSMRGDEAHWVAIEILKVALAAKEWVQ
ncbi:MAG: hypothetical protein AB7E70_19535 [Hyphomicrobiaceae bacterium]